MVPLMEGFASAVVEFMAEHQYSCQLVRMGIPDRFIEHGSQDELYALCGFGPEAVLQKIIELVGAHKKKTRFQAAIDFLKQS